MSNITITRVMTALLWILFAILIMDAVTIVLASIIEFRDPQKILAWAVIIIILPAIGCVGYFVIGQRVLLHGMYRKKRDAETEIESGHGIDAGTGYYLLDSLRGISTSEGNSVEMFYDGKRMFNSLLNDIENATRSIFIEFYIIFDDVLGSSVIDALCRKGKEGVDVRVIGDGFGSRKLKKETLVAMKESNVRFTFINRFRFPILDPRKNNCDHRKLVVIDSSISYCGGFNICDDYIGNGRLGEWRDSAVRMIGDVSKDIEFRFLQSWSFATGNHENFIVPDHENKGDVSISLICGGPDIRPNPILMQYISMIRSAKDEILVNTPYLINAELMNELMDASSRGVNVKVIIPGRPDHWFNFWNNFACAKRMLKKGVRFYLYEDGFMHSKTVVVDGKKSSIGSANFDDRSAYYNFDANALFQSESIAGELKGIFEKDLDHCREFDPSDYPSFISWIKILICGIVRPLA